MFRTARWNLVALGVVGCGGTPAATFHTTATPKDAVACLTAVLDSADYTVERVDRKKGSVLASQQVPGGPVSDMREFRRTDKIAFDQGKGGDWVYKAYGIRQLASAVGNQEETIEATNKAIDDANSFAKRCGQ